MKNNIVVSVVIGSYNRLPFLQATVDTVRKELEETPHELIIIDGGSSDGTVEWLIKQKDIITILQHNRGEQDGKPIERKSWGYFMNLGFRSASGKYVCMLSDDCLVIPGAILNGVDEFDKELKKGRKLGGLAFYWRNWPEQKTYWVGRTFGERLFVNHGLYLRDALQAVNFIDAETYFFYHADGDLGLRMWEAGYECIDASNSYVEHYSDANTAVRQSNLEKQKQDWATYTKNWGHLSESPGSWDEKEYRDNTNTAKKYWSDIEAEISSTSSIVEKHRKGFSKLRRLKS